jgi:hypothetical protein
VLDKLVDLLLATETVDGSQVYALSGRPEPVATTPGLTMVPDRAAAMVGTSVGETSRQGPDRVGTAK